MKTDKEVRNCVQDKNFVFQKHAWKFFFFLFILAASLSSLQGEAINTAINSYYRFQRITNKEGLSSNRILDIYQDRMGFIWFGTEQGLNRYDGYSMVCYYHDTEDPNSLSGNIVTSMAEDSSGNLWIGTNGGLNMLNRSDYTFRRVLLGGSGNQNPDYVRALLIDTNNILWAETVDGFLLRKNLKTGETQRFEHEKPGQTDVYYYHTIYQDKSNKLWLGGRAMGPYCFDEENNGLTFFPSTPDSIYGKTLKDISCFLNDKVNNFWVAGVDGLYRLDTTNGLFYRIMEGSVFDLQEGPDDNLWIGTGKGLKVWNRKKNEIITIQNDVDNVHSLPDNHVSKIYFDRAGTLWVGTIEGIAKYSFSANKFQTCFHIPGDGNSLSSSYITTILEDADHKIWLGTYDAGVDVFNKQFKKIKHLDINTKNMALASNKISALYQDKSGNIWIGLWSGTGFDKLEKHPPAIKHFSLDTNTTNYDWYNGFCEDENGNFWVSTWSSYGLQRFDANHFIDKPKQPGCIYPLSSNFTSVVKVDSKGFLWVGTTGAGLNRMNTKDFTVKIFRDDQKDSCSFWGKGVSAIYRDRERRLWFGGYGLNLLREKDTCFLHYTTINGLADNEIKAVLEDKYNRIWISTQNGLSMFDGSNSSFTNFYEKDGLPDHEFTKASCLLSDGRLLFGTKRGLVVISPERIPLDIIPPLPIITSVRIFGEPFPVDFSSGKTIKLNHNQNHVGFTFSASDFNFSSGNKYAYKLVNYDEEWRYADAEKREAGYSRLPPGKYQFLLKVANPDDLWSKPLPLNLEILPPFWQTPWFIYLAIALLISLIWGLIKYREKMLNRKHKADLVEQKLLRTQMNPHFIFNSLGAIQNYIFAHSSMESAAYLSRFAYLMRAILYSSREEFICLEDDLKMLEDYLLMQQLRFENKFDYVFEVGEINTEGIMVPPMLLQPFVENAIEHAFPLNYKKGAITIRVKKQLGFLLFEVEDNGIGFDAAKKKNKAKINRSMAMDITRERIQLLNNNSKKKYTYKVETLMDKNGVANGTKVTYFIPLNFKT